MKNDSLTGDVRSRPAGVNNFQSSWPNTPYVCRYLTRVAVTLSSQFRSDGQRWQTHADRTKCGRENAINFLSPLVIQTRIYYYTRVIHGGAHAEWGYLINGRRRRRVRENNNSLFISPSPPSYGNLWRRRRDLFAGGRPPGWGPLSP